MSEKIEQVARAIKWSRVKDEVASTNYMTGVTTFMRDIASEKTIDLDQSDLDAARAAIEAMQEPTPEMVKAGTISWDPMDGSPIRPVFDPTKPYQAMIKAVLR